MGADVIRRISEGDLIPSWYRVAYSDCTSMRFVCAPIGLHWIIRLGRRIWEWSLRYQPSRLEGMLHTQFQRGVRAEMIRINDVIEKKLQEVDDA